MSIQKIKKFRKNSFYEDEEVDTRPRENKSKTRRVERALRTKDISALVDDDEEEDIIDQDWKD